jgi:hypothetical protein
MHRPASSVLHGACLYVSRFRAQLSFVLDSMINRDPGRHIRRHDMKPIYNFRYIHHNLDATIRNHTGYRHIVIVGASVGRLNNFTSAKRESTVYGNST